MRKQNDWKRVLKADPTEWLLEEENPVVRFWALRDVVGASPGQIQTARKLALESAVAGEVFRQQKGEGHWENRANMHSPHYTSTVYQLTLLADLYFTIADKRVARGVEAVLETQKDDGGFPGHDPRKCPYGAYDIGLIIRFMHRFGMGGDPRVARMYEWLGEHQTPGGGWIGTKGECLPAPQGCLNAAANILWGLAEAGEFAGTEIAEKGLRFLAGATASNRDCRREASYPQFWNFWVDDVKLAEIYLKLGVSAGEEPLKRCLGAITGQQEDDGKWREGRGPYPGGRSNCSRMRRLFPKKGEPSKWVSAKAMAVLKRAYGGGAK